MEREFRRKDYWANDEWSGWEGGLIPSEFYETTPRNIIDVMTDWKTRLSPKKQTMKEYKLLQDFVNPVKTIRAGVIKTEEMWKICMRGLCDGDCAIKTDWFKEVPKERFNENDMMEFAAYVHSLSHRKDKAQEWPSHYLQAFLLNRIGNEWLNPRKV